MYLAIYGGVVARSITLPPSDAAAAAAGAGAFME